MNPLEFTGPEFLGIYLLLWAGLGSLWMAAHWLALGNGRPPSYDEMASLHAYELAYLMGGERRAIEASSAALIGANRLSFDLLGLKTVPGALQVNGYHPLDRSLLEACAGPALAPAQLESHANSAVASCMQVLRQRLELRRLLVADSSRLWFRSILLGLGGLVLLLGLAKLTLGISRSRPVGFLVLMLLFGTVLIAVWYRRGLPSVTRKGQLMQSILLGNHQGLRNPTRPLTVEEMAIAAGLFGIVAVSNENRILSSLFYTPPAKASFGSKAVGASGSSGCSSASCTTASSCGGSSCGGGGCGGGGCGGCGS